VQPPCSTAKFDAVTLLLPEDKRKLQLPIKVTDAGYAKRQMTLHAIKINGSYLRISQNLHHYRS
jgi:hypothetical protein